MRQIETKYSNQVKQALSIERERIGFELSRRAWMTEYWRNSVPSLSSKEYYSVRFTYIPTIRIHNTTYIYYSPCSEISYILYVYLCIQHLLHIIIKIPLSLKILFNMLMAQKIFIHALLSLNGIHKGWNNSNMYLHIHHLHYVIQTFTCKILQKLLFSCTPTQNMKFTFTSANEGTSKIGNILWQSERWVVLKVYWF